MNKIALSFVACLTVFQSICFVNVAYAGLFGFGEDVETFSDVENIMSGRRLKALAMDRTFYLETPLGTEMPITFYSDGSVKGKAGAVARYLSKRKTVNEDKGTWWIKGKAICSKWNIWFDGQAFCLKARKKGAKIHWWSNKGQNGQARLGQQVFREAKTINDLLKKYK